MKWHVYSGALFKIMEQMRGYTKGLLICGLLSSLQYIAMCIFIPMLWKDYHSVSQTVSELSAIGAPTRILWVWLATLYTLLVIAFAVGVWQSAGGNRPLRIAGMLVFIDGCLNLLWPFAPMHQRVDLAAGMRNGSDTLHVILASVTVLLLAGAMAYGATAFGKRFRIYSIVSIIILLLFGGLTALEAPRVMANLPTPQGGVWERIAIGDFLLWVVVVGGNFT
jgi:hypothetical protein